MYLYIQTAEGCLIDSIYDGYHQTYAFQPHYPTMTLEPTVEDLLAGVAARDEKAFAGLYDRLAPGLLGLVVRIIPGRKEAEEVLTTIFLRLWKEASRLHRERASASVWLVLAARAAAIERVKGRRGTSGRDELDALKKSLAWLPRPDEIRLLNERRDLLRKVIRQLPNQQFAALDDVVFEGCSEADLVQKLNEPLGRVKTELRAAMRFLRHRARAVLGSWVANI